MAVRHVLIHEGFGARFASPVPTAKPPGARLLEACRPKLNRRLGFCDHLAFSQWIRLEAEPGLLKFCERPARVDGHPETCVS